MAEAGTTNHICERDSIGENIENYTIVYYISH